jgi:hypothetical protein
MSDQREKIAYDFFNQKCREMSWCDQGSRVEGTAIEAVRAAYTALAEVRKTIDIEKFNERLNEQLSKPKIWFVRKSNLFENEYDNINFPNLSDAASVEAFFDQQFLSDVPDPDETDVIYSIECQGKTLHSKTFTV